MNVGDVPACGALPRALVWLNGSMAVLPACWTGSSLNAEW